MTHVDGGLVYYDGQPHSTVIVDDQPYHVEPSQREVYWQSPAAQGSDDGQYSCSYQTDDDDCQCYYDGTDQQRYGPDDHADDTTINDDAFHSAALEI